MKAVQFTRFGAPDEVAEIVDLPEPPAPGHGHALVEFLCAPINPADLLNLQGVYGVVPPLPAIGGLEGVGRVAAVGPGVAHVRPGDRVLLGGGTWRERQVVPAAGLFPLPEGPAAEQLAMLTVNPLTARALLREVDLQPGEFVIKNAANSGVGRSLFAFARRAGLRGIAVVRRPGLEDMLRSWGAEHVLVDGPDLAERVRAIVGGGTLRLGIDAVGGGATGRIAAALDPGGAVINYGVLANEPCHVSPADLIFRRITLRGYWLLTWFQRTPRDEIAAAYADVIAMLSTGDTTTPIEATYPLAQAKEALRHAARDHRGGKVLLVAG